MATKSNEDIKKEIFSELAKLPFFNAAIKRHVHIAITRENETTKIAYTVMSDLKYKKQISDQIFKTISETAKQLGASIIYER